MASEAVPAPVPSGPASVGFLRKLFDFSFENSITTTLIKVLYVLWLIGSAFGGLGVLIALAGAAGGVGIVLGLIAGPITFLWFLILGRVYCELLIVLFRVADNTRELVRLTRERP